MFTALSVFHTSLKRNSANIITLSNACCGFSLNASSQAAGPTVNTHTSIAAVRDVFAFGKTARIRAAIHPRYPMYKCHSSVHIFLLTPKQAIIEFLMR